MSELEYPAGPALHRRARVGAAPASDGVVRVGITSFAQDALGDIVYVCLPAVGDTVAAGDTCGEVESTKRVSDLYAPRRRRGDAPSTRRSTRPPSWSTPTRTARAGCSSSRLADAGRRSTRLLDVDDLPRAARPDAAWPHRVHRVRRGHDGCGTWPPNASSRDLGLGHSASGRSLDESRSSR